MFGSLKDGFPTEGESTSVMIAAIILGHKENLLGAFVSFMYRKKRLSVFMKLFGIVGF